MKKKNLIFIISVILGLVLCGAAVLAAFIFQTSVGSSSITGNINIGNEGYVSYALNSNISKEGLTTEEYQAILKERAGELEVDKTVETDINTNYSRYYVKTGPTEAETYSAGNNYYIQDDTGNYIYQDITAFETGVTYYTISYAKATSYNASTTYYRLGHQVDTTVTSSNYSSYYVLTGIDLEGYGIYELASGYSETTKYYKIVYGSTTATASGLINDPNSNAYGVSCVNTYGTQRTGSLAETDNYIYLNQIGFHFEIQTNIDCYVRIKFRDAWISSKLYRGSSTPIVKYTSKKTISGRSPFYVDNQAWYYDTNDNVAYLKTCISKRDLAYSYSFTVNPSYFYIPPTASFTERMIVQVSYSLEVIQANRAKAVWGKDPSTLS